MTGQSIIQIYCENSSVHLVARWKYEVKYIQLLVYLVIVVMMK